MLGVVVVAGHEGLEAAGQAVDGRIERGVIFVGEHDVEVSIELGGSKVAEVFGDESEANKIALAALFGCQSTGRIARGRGGGGKWRRTWLKMSFFVSSGRSKKLRGLRRERLAALSQDSAEAMMGDGARWSEKQVGRFAEDGSLHQR